MRKRFVFLTGYMILISCGSNNIPISKPTPIPIITSSQTPVVTVSPTSTLKQEFNINLVKYCSIVVLGDYDNLFSRNDTRYYYNFSGDGNLISDTRSPDYKVPFVIDLKYVSLYKTVNLSAKVILNDNSSYTDIVWESSDNSIFEVSQDGKIAPINTGKANVIVKEKTSGKILISSEIDIIGQRYMPTPSPTTPSPSQTATTGEYYSHFEDLSGLIEDTQGNKLDNVQIVISNEDFEGILLPGALQISSNGTYVFKVITGAYYKITASKKGYKSVTLKTDNIRSSENGDPSANKCNFTGANALQKE